MLARNTETVRQEEEKLAQPLSTKLTVSRKPKDKQSPGPRCSISPYLPKGSIFQSEGLDRSGVIKSIIFKTK